MLVRTGLWYRVKSNYQMYSVCPKKKKRFVTPQDLLAFALNTFSVSLAAIISGSVLLYVHHSKIRQEIELQIKREQFESRKRLYRDLWVYVDDLIDYKSGILEDLNWRRWRKLQSELSLAGSIDVLEAFNKIMRNADSASQDELTKLIKDFWNTIRQDLFREPPLPYTALRFVEPSRHTLQAVEIFTRHAQTLKAVDIRSLFEMKDVDVEQLHSKCGIPVAELQIMKDAAERESRVRKQAPTFSPE